MDQSQIPSRPDDLTAQWLTSVLGEIVDSVEVSPVGTGQVASTYRVAHKSRSGHGEMRSQIAKVASQDPMVRERVALGYRAEHAFYTRAASTLAVPVPKWVHCAISDDATQFILLMEDMAPAVQGDQIRGCTYDEARLAVEALAGLHGPRWCDPAWLSFDGLTMPMADAAFAGGMQELAKLALSTTLETIADRLDVADRDVLESYTECVAQWLLMRQHLYCLLHGDFRADNLLFNPDHTAVTVVDWQTITVGLPARDLAYFLGTSLPTEQRRVHERSLVECYHAHLLAAGVTDYDLETCWDDYCLSMLQVPLITTLGAAFSAASDRGEDMVTTMLSRGCCAIRELDTINRVASETLHR